MTRWTLDGLTAGLDRFEVGPVDLELVPGSAVAVLGRSGAGKTTLLRAVAGFLPARAGRLLRDGDDVTGTPPERRGLGYVPQGLGLLPHRSVERNVSYPLEVRGRTDAIARSRSLLRDLGLAALARRYPAQLSGGEAQRVALARALAAEPELVLWDEPGTALDVDGQRQLARVLHELTDAVRVPVVVVTHDPELAFSVAEVFLLLRAGGPAFRGRALELLESPPDAFAARFAGYENVYDPAGLAAAPAGSLAAWLADRAGPGGVAFARPIIAPTPRGAGRWEGRVRSVRPGPDGLAVSVDVGPIRTALLRPRPFGPPVPAVGEALRFDVEAKDLRPLKEGESGAGS